MCTKYRPPNPKAIKRQLGTMFGETITKNDVRPTDLAPMIGRSKSGDLSGSLASFGMIGNWDGTDKAKPLANVRQETIEQSNTFSKAYKQRRCIIPAEGFYEWQKVDGAKVPYYFSRNDGLLFYFAGLWQPEGGGHFSSSIITTIPNKAVSPYHSRMPLALENWEQWLDQDDPLKIVQLTPESLFTVTEVQSMPVPMPLFEVQR